MRPKDVTAPTRFAWRTVSTTPDRFSLTGKAMTYSGTNAGTVYIDTTNSVVGYSLDDGQNNVAYGSIPLPPNWGGKYYRISWAWLPAGTAAGTARFGIGATRIKSGTALAALEAIAPIYSASTGSKTTPKVTMQNLATALPTDIGEDEFLAFAIRRRGDESDDTFSDDLYLIAVEIEIL
jgi:hypothetical protein